MEREPSSDSGSDTGAPPTGANPLDWPRLAHRTEPVVRAIEDYARRRRQRRIALSAAIGVFMLAAAIGWRERWVRREVMPSSGEATPHTLVSAPARQILPDGSLVELNAHAEIAVDFTAASTGVRRVVLTRGEAHFSVAKNPQRPFVVAVDGIEVRAVGTAFAVQRGNTAVEVLVTEGRVAVDRPVSARAAAAETTTGPSAATAAPLAFVDAGNRAVVATEGPVREARVEAVSTPELEERLSWRVPRLEFNATPLAEVVALFNRHAAQGTSGSRTSLMLSDPELRALPLSGTLRADNTTVLLQILETSYGIKAERRPGGEILLRKGS